MTHYERVSVLDTMLNKKLDFQQGLRDGMPICLGYISVAFAFGMEVVKGGLPSWAAILITLTNFTSAGQFAGASLIISGTSYLELATTMLIINIRYSLMALSLSQKSNHTMTVPKRFALSFGITDETFAVAMQQNGLVNAKYLSGLMLGPYLGWALGTALGATATGLLPFEIRSALGIALYAMFIAIIIPSARKMRPIMVTAALSAAISCILRYLPATKSLSGGWVVIIASVIAAVFAAWKFPIAETGNEEVPV